MILKKALQKTAERFSRPDIFFYGSLYLIALLAAGTVEQKTIGLYQARLKYFSGAFVSFFGLPLPSASAVLSLICAGLLIKIFFYTKDLRKNSGSFVMHVAAVLLLAAGFLSSKLSREGYIIVREGEESRSVLDYYNAELALTNENSGRTAVFPQKTLVDSGLKKALPLSCGRARRPPDKIGGKAAGERRGKAFSGLRRKGRAAAGALCRFEGGAGEPSSDSSGGETASARQSRAGVLIFSPKAEGAKSPAAAKDASPAFPAIKIIEFAQNAEPSPVYKLKSAASPPDSEKIAPAEGGLGSAAGFFRRFVFSPLFKNSPPGQILSEPPPSESKRKSPPARLQYRGQARKIRLKRKAPSKEREQDRAALIFSLFEAEAETEAKADGGGGGGGAGAGAGGETAYLVFEGLPEVFEWKGRKYRAALRPEEKARLPFSLHLIDFQRSVYPGTEKPRSFLSLVEIQSGLSKEKGAIEMNRPLRRENWTIYQSSFQEGEKDLAVFAAVQNPARRAPYFASLILCLGALIPLFASLQKPRRRLTAPPELNYNA